MEIIAHRGASHDAPENTLAAVRLAWAQHADAVECDVRLTRDGLLAVIHDPDTQRTTGHASLVRETTLADLQHLDAGGWKHAKFAGEKIPSLDALLALVPAGKRVFVEVKGGPEAIDALERSITRSGLASAQLVIIAFEFATACAAKTRLKEIPACWIVERDSEPGRLPLAELVARTRAAGLDGLDLEVTFPIDVGFVQQIRAAGIKLYVWTLDDSSPARDLIAAGVDGITTNRPGWLRERLAT
jgi:glycerophosphoryl diester phosphodiesterase